MHLSSSYFNIILSLPLTSKTSSLTISLTTAPTCPSAKLSFHGHSVIRTYYFYHSVSLKPSFHACLSTSLIFLSMCFFQNSPVTVIPSFTIPFKLTSLNQIRFFFFKNNFQHPFHHCFCLSLSLSSILSPLIYYLHSPLQHSSHLLPIPFCIASKSSHSYTSVPHSYISLVIDNYFSAMTRMFTKIQYAMHLVDIIQLALHPLWIQYQSAFMSNAI